MAEYYRILHNSKRDNPTCYGTGSGRWNIRNTPMIYAASSVSLAITEYLCIKGSSVMQTQWCLVTFSISIEIPQLDIDSLPIDWDSRPHPLSTQQFGKNWSESNASVCVKVPSARIPVSTYPKEHNLLINPLHPEFNAACTIKSVEDIYFHLNEWASGDQ